MRVRHAQRGFTLLEIVIALAILAILVTMATPVIQLQAQRQKETELRQALRDIRTAIDAYKKAFDEGRIERKVDATGYPPTLATLTAGVVNAKDPKKTKIYFLRRLPRDPMNYEEGLSAEQTWALRSYASPPDEPKEGDDVFDVFSKSSRRGINGVPYKDW